MTWFFVLTTLSTYAPYSSAVGSYIGPLTEAHCLRIAAAAPELGTCREASAMMSCSYGGAPGSDYLCPRFDGTPSVMSPKGDKLR